MNFIQGETYLYMGVRSQKYVSIYPEQFGVILWCIKGSNPQIYLYRQEFRDGCVPDCFFLVTGNIRIMFLWFYYSNVCLAAHQSQRVKYHVVFWKSHISRSILEKWNESFHCKLILDKCFLIRKRLTWGLPLFCVISEISANANNRLA